MNSKIHVTNRKDWRLWLSKNHYKEKEIWLVYHKKHTGKPRVSYDDAVEEALCFGWIASAKKEETKQKRVKEAISKLSKNQKLGMK